MGKYDELKYLKMAKARVAHLCNKCGRQILKGDIYYVESLKDKFLQILHAKKFCCICFEQVGENLIR
jgi:hypothetical protein